MDILSLICFLCILPIFILLFFGVVIGIIYRDRRKHTDAWRELALRSGLTFHEPGWFLGRPRLTGDWHGRAVHIYTRTSGTPGMGTSPSAYMQMEMAINLTEGTRFTLWERDLLHQPGEQDIRAGDAEFDQRFIVRGYPPELIRRLLMETGLRRSLLGARTLNLETTREHIRYRQLNIETNVETMQSLLSLLFDLAETLERAQTG